MTINAEKIMMNFNLKIVMSVALILAMLCCSFTGFCSTDTLRNAAADSLELSTVDSVSTVSDTINIIPALVGISTVVSAAATEEVQIYDKYRVVVNAHGYAAEDANNVNDRLHGRKVQAVGHNNASDGPDRIVDGQQIQTKYCKSAKETVSTAFNKETGLYRYTNQQLEVPADQYEEAVKLMEDKIREGKVPGHTNPDDAKIIVRKGCVTYKQACDITKPLTLESLKFDAKTGIVSCGYVIGISAACVFIIEVFNGKDPDEAAIDALEDGGLAGAMALGTHVVTNQILRTEALDKMLKHVDKLAENINKKIDGTLIGKIRDKAIEGFPGKDRVINASGQDVIKKLTNGTARRMLGTNIISGDVATAAVTVPDVVKGCKGKKSWKEVKRNAVSNTAGMAGGIAGAWAGTGIGTMICPGIGSAIGGIIGGLAGGIGCSFCTESIMKYFDSKSNKGNKKRSK